MWIKYSTLAAIALLTLSSCKSKKEALTITNTYVEARKTGEETPEPEPQAPEVTLNPSQVKRLAKLLEVPESTIENTAVTNHKLYVYIFDWLYTPYLFGGTDRNGIDCSAFIQQLVEEVYGNQLGRTCDEMIVDEDNILHFRNRKGLKEGDLIFFKGHKGRIATHVGMYLKNGYFVSATTKKGVGIDRLQDYAWTKNYLVSGRLQEAAAKEEGTTQQLKTEELEKTIDDSEKAVEKGRKARQKAKALERKMS